MSFYMPLVLTTLLTLLMQPIGSAALGRMPLALESLAVWPVVSGLVSLFRSMGTAYNEVVVALLDQPNGKAALRRFGWQMTAATSLALVVMTATPLAGWWFSSVSSLRPDLGQMAGLALWLALPLPGLTVLQSWFQGTLVHHRQTRSITESVVIFLAAAVLGLAAGAYWNPGAGLFSAMTAFTLANTVQTLWLWVRAGKI